MEEFKDQQKKEALNRLRLLQMNYGLMENVVKEFETDNTLYYSEYINSKAQGILYWLDNEDEYINAVKEFEKEHQAMAYHTILVPMEFGTILSVLYVSKHQEEWLLDREDLDDGLPLAYNINLDDNTISEFGTIEIVGANGGISRIN